MKNYSEKREHGTVELLGVPAETPAALAHATYPSLLRGNPPGGDLEGALGGWATWASYFSCQPFTKVDQIPVGPTGYWDCYQEYERLYGRGRVVSGKDAAGREGLIMLGPTKTMCIFQRYIGSSSPVVTCGEGRGVPTGVAPREAAEIEEVVNNVLK